MNYRSLIGANASLLSGLASQDATPPDQIINTYSNPSNVKRFDSLVNSLANAGAQFTAPSTVPTHHRRRRDSKFINPSHIKPRSYHRNTNGITDTIDYSRDIDPSHIKPRYRKNDDENNDDEFNDEINNDDEAYSYDEPIVDPTVPVIPDDENNNDDEANNDDENNNDVEPTPAPTSAPSNNTPPMIPPPMRSASISVYTVVIILVVILLVILIFKLLNEQSKLERVINRSSIVQ